MPLNCHVSFVSLHFRFGMESLGRKYHSLTEGLEIFMRKNVSRSLSSSKIGLIVTYGSL